jgi:hypothetical protein
MVPDFTEAESVPTAMQQRVNDFVLDVFRISTELDKISRRDPPEVRAFAVKTGTDAYQRLLERQYSLALTPAETSMIQIMLDRIKARLKFLSRA